MARENCGDYDADDQELVQCYTGYNAKNCEDENEFDLQEYLECNQYGDDEYFVGPYCAEDGASIFLGYFTEETCTTQASEGLFEQTYGATLEYSDYSIVADSCANCREHGEHQNDGDAEDEDDVLEQCEDLYRASKGWDEVAPEFADKVHVGGRSRGEKVMISLLVIFGVLALVACCWFGFGRKKKETLLSAE